jgi:hypothetical protein
MALPQRVMPLEQEACPVPEMTLGSLYAAPKRDLAGILSKIPGLQRARLAVFCNARAHLREMGLAIAATCEKGDLVEVAGPLGSILHAQSREQAEHLPEHNPRFRRRPISLATVTPTNLMPLDMDEEEAALDQQEHQAS